MPVVELNQIQALLAALLFVLVAAMVGLKLSGDSKRAVQPSSGRGR